jgi:hypothetical protein
VRAHLVGGGIGWLASGVLFYITWGLGVVVVGFVVGLLVGGAQAWVLQRHVFRTTERWDQWIVVTTVVGGISWLITISIRLALNTWYPPLPGIGILRDDRPLPWAVAVIAGGALLGGAQWFILRKFVRGAGWWVIANAAGAAIGSLFAPVVGIAAYHAGVLPRGAILMGPNEAVPLLVGGLIGTIVWSMIVGAVLSGLVKRPSNHDPTGSLAQEG